ncbi:uncharacterized protein LOC143572406 [Bidens hawaiensis]|uniref:uncharacterized protein LOC143572406 n=1 Tax=Bidens hawaiensis TaxID=980011 RepID=UPI004049B21E
MIGGKCSKSFPKRYQLTTSFDKNGYIHYKRPPNGFSVKKNGIDLDNAYVVPYNRNLCLRFNAHINVEYCRWNMMIKYLFKYISKGSDHIRFKVTQPSPSTTPVHNTLTTATNEIDSFVDGRYICSHEAAWRILNFTIHHRYPAVQVLAVHLENMQNVSLRDRQQLQNVVNNPAVQRTTLTEWFTNNESDPSGQHLRYIDYLSEYKWDGRERRWIRRTQQTVTTIGRLVYIHPSCGETFYLRMLLNHQTGCKSFTDIRTVNDIIHVTYRAACESLGLLADDSEWSIALEEAKAWTTPKELRSLFSHILLHCEVANPIKLFENQWRPMSEDIPEITTSMLAVSKTMWQMTRYTTICFEALDRTLKDIQNNNKDPFGGKSVLLGGDFRQTLPVKHKATKSEIICFSLPRSYLWPKFKMFKLTQNMRVLRPNMDSETATDAQNFSDWLLSIGNGLCGKKHEDQNENSRVIDIQTKYIIPNCDDPILNLVHYIYDVHSLNQPTPSDLVEKAIVCPKNKTADYINQIILNMLPGNPTTYLSTDIAVPRANENTDIATIYPTEYLNTLHISGFPQHELKLKVNVPIILLRNFNQDLC